MQSVTSNAVAESLQGSTYTDSDGIIYKKIGNVVTISGYGVTAGTLHNKNIPSEYRTNNNLTFCCYVRGSNEAFLGFLGITNKFYLTFIPSYPADNTHPSNSAFVYFTVTYII